MSKWLVTISETYTDEYSVNHTKTENIVMKFDGVYPNEDEVYGLLSNKVNAVITFTQRLEG